MFNWLLGSKINKYLSSSLLSTKFYIKLDCRDEYYTGVSYDNLARRILQDARDIATRSGHSDEPVVVVTHGVDDFHRKLIECIGCKAPKFDLQLVVCPRGVIKLRKLC